MSVPPDPPPAPARPPQGGRSGRVWGAGCLLLFLAVAVAGVVSVRRLKAQLTDPDRASLVGSRILVGRAEDDGRRLQKAVAECRMQTGAYPRSLLDLVAENRIDGKLLHNDLDPSQNPGRPSWRYVPPPEGSPGTAPLLAEPFTEPRLGGASPRQIVVTLGGDVSVQDAPPTPGGP